MRLLQVCRISNIARFSTISRISPTSIQENAKTNSAKNIKTQNEQEIAKQTIPIFKQALSFNKKIALKDRNGEFSYFDLVAGSNKLSSEISDICGN